MRHINIPVFIPHLGCPNQCVFCNQRTISGVREFDPNSVRDIIDEALSTVTRDDFVEIAFFGGSFTGIDRELMISLLDIAYSYVCDGRVTSIRCSTRPDYIDEEIIGILKKYRVCVVELGLQSTSDRVLEITKRNHSFADEARACKLIAESGLKLVGQMMVGLPGATLEDELQTARFIIDAGADSARVYPTVVFRDTELCSMSIDGIYKPLSLEDAVYRTAKVVELLRTAGVKVIRVGLCASDNLSADDTYFAGPNHPALGELVENRIYYDKISDKMQELSLNSESVVEIYIPRGATSKAVGQKKRNKFLLIESFGIKDAVFIESAGLSNGEISIVKRKENKCT